MNRFDQDNISYKVEGYFIKGFRDSDEETFHRAKGELIRNLRKEMRQVNELTFEQFEKSKQRRFK